MKIISSFFRIFSILYSLFSILYSQFSIFTFCLSLSVVSRDISFFFLFSPYSLFKNRQRKFLPFPSLSQTIMKSVAQSQEIFTNYHFLIHRRLFKRIAMSHNNNIYLFTNLLLLLIILLTILLISIIIIIIIIIIISILY